MTFLKNQEGHLVRIDTTYPQLLKYLGLSFDTKLSQSQLNELFTQFSHLQFVNITNYYTNGFSDNRLWVSQGGMSYDDILRKRQEEFIDELKARIKTPTVGDDLQVLEQMLDHYSSNECYDEFVSDNEL